MSNRLALILLLATSPLFAQTRFNGTWEMKMDTLQFFNGAEKYLLQNGVYTCLTCRPEVSVKMDGTDQHVTGHYFDTIAIHVVDSASVQFTMKRDGNPTFVCTETVSQDGKAMIEDFSDNPVSRQSTGKATFIRVAQGPPGSHALSGSWEMRRIKNIDGRGPTTTYQSTTDGMKVSAGGSTFEARFDGKDYPVQGDPGRSTVSLKLLNHDTIKQTDKHDGRVIRITRLVVSRDGNSMKVESTDEELGRTGKYTAVKVQ